MAFCSQARISNWSLRTVMQLGWLNIRNFVSSPASGRVRAISLPMVSGMPTASICPTISACAEVASSSKRTMRVPRGARRTSACSCGVPRGTPTCLPARSAQSRIGLSRLAISTMRNAL